MKKGVFRNLTKFAEKAPVPGLRPATLLKRKLWHMYFPVNLTEISTNTFFTERLWWLYKPQRAAARR